MGERIIFLSEGKMNLVRGSETSVLTSAMAEAHRQKLKEISMRNEWKKSGSGARFMGVGLAAMEGLEQGESLNVSGVAGYSEGAIVYSFNSQTVGGVYLKSIDSRDTAESYVLVKEKLRFFGLDVNAAKSKIVAAAADTYLERHLAVIDVDKRELSMLTEGDCYDSNPLWSGKDENVVYYDSCGLGYDANANFVRYGPRSVYRLDTASGDLTEVLVGGKEDYLSPYEDKNGDLFYIKRPYAGDKPQGMSFTDIALMPFRVLRAVFGWLNFFTQRYTGEPLKTGGGNPAKARQKSAEEIFIDGNLIDAERNLRRSMARGIENPGYAPLSWELTLKPRVGDERVLKRGVISYRVLADGSVLYSNGKYIIRLRENGGEEVVAKAHLATGLAVCEV